MAKTNLLHPGDPMPALRAPVTAPARGRFIWRCSHAGAEPRGRRVPCPKETDHWRPHRTGGSSDAADGTGPSNSSHDDQLPRCAGGRGAVRRGAAGGGRRGRARRRPRRHHRAHLARLDRLGVPAHRGGRRADRAGVPAAPAVVAGAVAAGLGGRGVAGAGPFDGHVASRTVGVPGDPRDVGNWGYWAGTVSLLVEAALVMLCLSMLAARLRLWPCDQPPRRAGACVAHGRLRQGAEESVPRPPKHR
jgi:hypothetical protein